MSKDENFKKIVISERTLSQMTSDLLEKLKQEGVSLIVVGNDMISEIKMIAKQEQASAVILINDEEKELSKEDFTDKDIQERIFELKDLPKLSEIIELYPELQKKKKFYVPRTIGKPNSKKRGGR